MPNHVLNVWKISGIPTKDMNYVLSKITRVTNDGERVIDFDLIIPEPRFKRDCPKDCIVNSKSHVQEDKDRPWFNWYNWHINYWGTKWNAYDCYTHIDKDYIEFNFNTAWSFAEPIVNRLAKMGYDLDIQYADEDIGSNCGYLTYDSATGEWTDHDLDDPEKFARDLWGWEEEDE